MGFDQKFDFSGKHVFITGGTKGLGLSTAEAFARAGANLILGYRSDEESTNKALKDIEALGVQCQLIKADLSASDAMTNIFSEISALDIYVHNAAATAFKPLLKIEPHHVEKTMNISINSFIQGVKLAQQKMNSGGAIITVGGMDTDKVVSFHGLLAAAKAGLEQLTRYFAHELAPHNIRVNGVNPGFLETQSTQIMLGPHFEKISKAYSESLPLKRPARLEEVANIILFLASDTSSWIVGETIRADGGFHRSINFL